MNKLTLFLLLFLFSCVILGQNPEKNNDYLNGTWYYIDSTCNCCDNELKINYYEIYFNDSIFLNYSTCYYSNPPFLGRYKVTQDTITLFDRNESFTLAYINVPFPTERLITHTVFDEYFEKTSIHYKPRNFYIFRINDNQLKIKGKCKKNNLDYFILLNKIPSAYKIKFKKKGSQLDWKPEIEMKKFESKAKKRASTYLNKPKIK